MQKNSLAFYHLLALLTVIIWGTTFVAQSMGSNYVDPFTFNGLRFTIAGIILLIAVAQIIA